MQHTMGYIAHGKEQNRARAAKVDKGAGGLIAIANHAVGDAFAAAHVPAVWVGPLNARDLVVADGDGDALGPRPKHYPPAFIINIHHQHSSSVSAFDVLFRCRLSPTAF
jgi:hypothetical protein